MGQEVVGRFQNRSCGSIVGPGIGSVQNTRYTEGRIDGVGGRNGAFWVFVPDGASPSMFQVPDGGPRGGPRFTHHVHLQFLVTHHYTGWKTLLNREMCNTTLRIGIAIGATHSVYLRSCAHFIQLTTPNLQNLICPIWFSLFSSCNRLLY